MARIIEALCLFASFSPTMCTVQLAFGVMTYQRQNQMWNDTFHEFQRLMKVIYHPDKHIYILHVDIKSNTSLIDSISNEYCEPKSNCKTIKSRNIAWGSLSTGEMMLALMQEAYDDQHVVWDYFTLLDHQSLPLVTLNFLEIYLSSFPKETNFIHCWNIKNYDFFGQYESNSWRLQETVIDDFAGNLIETSFKREPPDDIEFFKSLQHIVLSRSFIKYVLFGPDTRRILLYLMNVKTADEMFLSTLIQNHSYFATTASCMTTLHFSHWVKPGGSWHPEYLTLEHLPLLLSQAGVSALFARKFHYLDSQELVDVLQRIRDEVFTDYQYDTCISYGKANISLPLYTIQSIYNHQKGRTYLPVERFPPYKYPDYQDIVNLRNKSLVSSKYSFTQDTMMKHSLCEKKKNYFQSKKTNLYHNSCLPLSMMTSAQNRYFYLSSSMKWLLPIAIKYIIKLYNEFESMMILSKQEQNEVNMNDRKFKELGKVYQIIENSNDMVRFISELNIINNNSKNMTLDNIEIVTTNDDDDVFLSLLPTSVSVGSVLDLLDQIRLARESIATEEFLNYYAHIGFRKVYDANFVHDSNNTNNNYSKNNSSNIINDELEIQELKKCIVSQYHHSTLISDIKPSNNDDDNISNATKTSQQCDAKLLDESIDFTCTDISSDTISIVVNNTIVEIVTEKQKKEKNAMIKTLDFHKKAYDKKSPHFARRPQADTFQEFLSKHMVP